MKKNVSFGKVYKYCEDVVAREIQGEFVIIIQNEQSNATTTES